jgi:hypothetical protein
MRTRRIVVVLLLSIGLAVSVFSCSGDKEEKGRIEKMTEETGRELADKITAPIDKAKAVKVQQEDRDRKSAERLADE